MYSVSKTISRQSALVVLSSVILVSAIAGLIMDASGVPWYSEGEDRDIQSGTYDDYDAKDWEDCCEESYDMILEMEDNGEDRFDTFILTVSPLTSYFVMILIFSAVCLICLVIPFDIRYKVPLVTLFGLATTVVGIFLARKSSITFSSYLSQLANSGGAEVGFHPHVMIYFGMLVSVLCLILGSLIIASVKHLLSQTTQVSRSMLKRSQLFLSLSLVVFLASPLVPITYASYDSDDLDNDFFDYDLPEGEYLFPSQMLAIDDSITSSDDGYDDDDLEYADSTIGNYALVEDFFFVLMWINLSVIMLMSMALIPVVGKFFSGLSQLNILSAPLIILALIFSIIMYVNLPDLLGDNAYYDEDSYESIYLHVNWLPLVCCILATINWIAMLIKSHIPWWKEVSSSTKKVFTNFTQAPNPAAFGNPSMMQGQFNQQQMMQQQMAQQQFAQQQLAQQQLAQQQFGQQQFGRQPPGY